jgi:hypothetical protein
VIRYEFEIGKAFPASDEVARFVTVLAMISNDWHRTMKMMPRTGPAETAAEERGLRIMLARHEAASCFEAMVFVADSRRRFPQSIEPFVSGLGPTAQQRLGTIAAALDHTSPDYQAWLQGHRNVTSHYPELDPDKYANGKEEIGNALAAAAKHTGTISVGEKASSVRFGFADEVGVQLLPDVNTEGTAIKMLSHARIALGLFIQKAVQAYRQAHPERFR